MTGQDGISLDEVRQKYATERNKRLRGDTVEQYIPIDPDSKYDIDPFAPEPTPRAPRVEEVEVVSVGGGIAGVVSAVELTKKGIHDFLIIEKGADFAGTWYWNRYPGIRCDVDSYLYLPLLEEMGYMPTERYASGPEIKSHICAIGEKFGLYERALLQTRVTATTWDEDTARWIVETNRGDRIAARYLLLGTGGLLHRPKLPGIPGIDSYQGESFHTSRWDFDYTGGDSMGGLTKLRDKRVAIIGTGATAIQVIPHLAEHAQELVVFQRTPSPVDIRANAPTDPEWYNSLEPDWQKRRWSNFDKIMFGMDREENLVNDSWTRIWGIPVKDPEQSVENYQQMLEIWDFEQMERVRSRVDELVEDPGTAEALKPYYATRCKRPCFHDGYHTVFNQPNVTLVNTPRGVDRITPTGLVVDGTEYEVDLIVYSTGFELDVAPDRAGGFPVAGRGGQLLSERWADGMLSLHGLYTHGFPNMILAGSTRQSGLSVNFTFGAAEHAKHIAALIAHLRERDATAFEITEAAEKKWARIMDEKSLYNEEATRNCTPGQYNLEGNPEAGRPFLADIYGGGTVEFVEGLDRWRAEELDADTVISSAAEAK